LHINLADASLQDLHRPMGLPHWGHGKVVDPSSTNLLPQEIHLSAFFIFLTLNKIKALKDFAFKLIKG
jgi:hypothetical protein